VTGASFGVGIAYIRQIEATDLTGVVTYPKAPVKKEEI